MWLSIIATFGASVLTLMVFVFGFSLVSFIVFRPDHKRQSPLAPYDDSLSFAVLLSLGGMTLCFLGARALFRYVFTRPPKRPEW